MNLKKIIQKVIGSVKHDLKIEISGNIKIKIIDSNHKDKVIFTKDIPLKSNVKIK